MNNVVQLVSHQQVMEEASLWIARLDRGLDVEEEANLRIWLEQSAQHVDAFLELAETWDDAGRLHLLGALFPLVSRDAESQSLVAAGRNWLMPATAVAATLLVALLAFIYVPMEFDAPETNATLHEYIASYETAVGELSTVSLPDSSMVTLNTNSKVDVYFDESRRKLRLLRGEASFVVAHNPTRPFIVDALNNEVRALGTTFNIELAEGDRTEVIVTDGSVRIRKLALPVESVDGDSAAEIMAIVDNYTLDKGEKILLTSSTDGDIVETLTETDMSDDLLWQSGKLAFRGETLESALDEVERYTTVRFVIADDTLRAKRIAGLYRAGDVSGLLTSLERNLGIEYERLGDGKVVLR